MTDTAFAETVDFYRVDTSLKLDTERRTALGQYMTPAPIGRFLASLFSVTREDPCVLDPGAGVGSLTVHGWDSHGLLRRTMDNVIAAI